MPNKTADLSLFSLGNVIFLGFHLATLIMVLAAGVPPLGAVALCLGSYLVRMVFVTAGYHRYFSHRTYKTSRWFQFVLALGSILSLQKGVLWWAAHHRAHHRHSDTERDVHSPVVDGFWWSHMGWVVASPADDDPGHEQVKDLARFPELRFLDRYVVFVGIFALMCAAVQFTLGFTYMTWGCFVSTLLLWHGTFTINSLAHVWGKRRYETSDESRNNAVLALITLGEGWHNNHHYYSSSANQGFRWYEVDPTFRLLWLLEKVGIVWDLRRAPPDVVAGTLGGRDWRVGAPTASPVPEPEPERLAA